MDIRKIAIVAGTLFFLAGVIISLATYRPAVEIGVTLRDYRIYVASSAVRQGGAVRLHIRNEGTEVHELEVEGYDLEVADIQPGEVRTLTFRANKAGSFELVCRMEDHHEKGMHTEFLVLK